MIRKIHPLVVLMIFNGAQHASAQQTWVLKGLEMPESVLVDSEREQLLVGNIVGDHGETDVNGYLSRVSFDGTLIEREWVTGLDTSKGMADISVDAEILCLPLMLSGQVNGELIPVGVEK
ncbi:MAG: hypothetical protein AB8B64_11520 [Granulosicoccus sp.]